jgi:hypothetical protein
MQVEQSVEQPTSNPKWFKPSGLNPAAAEGKILMKNLFIFFLIYNCAQ